MVSLSKSTNLDQKMASARPGTQRGGDAAWAKMAKAVGPATGLWHGMTRGADAPAVAKNGELFALTYGSLVTQLIKDFEDLKLVNQQLDSMCVFSKSEKLGKKIIKSKA